MSDAIDVKDLLERVQNDKELLVELLDIYQEDFPNKRRALGEALKANDLTGVKEAAHSLKGSSGNLSAKSLYKLCLELEQMAQVNDLSQTDKVLTSIDEEYKRLQTHALDIKKYFGK